MAKRRFLETRTKAIDPLNRAVDALMSRQKEILQAFRPGNEKQDRVFQSGALTMVVAGGNRSGKSYCAFTAFAARVMGQQAYGLDGELIDMKYHVPKAGEISRYWLVGYNLDHIGQTFYRMLFEPGMGGGYHIIFDPKEGRYVAWNENIKWHADNRDKRELAEPLIPQRMIKEESWTWNQYGGGYAKKCFSSVELVNGAVIYAFPSTTPQPKQGDPIHGLLIDEDVAHGGHVSEYFARLTDNQGWAIWSAWPHDENYILTNLIDGCQKAMEEGDTRSEYVLLTTDENPYFTDKTKKLAIDRMMMLDDDIGLVESRIRGVMGHEGRRMYDYMPMIHGIGSEALRRPVPDGDPGSPRWALQKVYRDDNKFPDSWTRRLAIDPSTQRSAVVFGVCPPPEVLGVTIPPTLIVENAIVMKRVTPDGLSMAIKQVIGDLRYEAFVIDRNFGRQRHFAAAGANVFEILADSFRKHGLSSRLTKEWCLPGCNVPENRQTSVRELLSGVMSGGPSVYVLLDTAYEFQKEIDRYYKKILDNHGSKTILDEPENPRKFDVMAAWEYLCHYVYELMQCNQHYVSPTVYGGDEGMSQMAKSVMSSGQANAYIHLGAGSKA